MNAKNRPWILYLHVKQKKLEALIQPKRSAILPRCRLAGGILLLSFASSNLILLRRLLGSRPKLSFYSRCCFRSSPSPFPVSLFWMIKFSPSIGDSYLVRHSFKFKLYYFIFYYKLYLALDRYSIIEYIIFRHIIYYCPLAIYFYSIVIIISQWNNQPSLHRFRLDICRLVR